jgi:DME family drug/metabolite transporter
MAQMARRNGQWLVLAAAVLWGTTGTAQALAPVGAEPLVVGALRLAVGGAGLLAVALCRGGLDLRRRWPIGVTFCAAFFTAAYQVCFFAGVARTGVAVGTIVGIGSSPIAAGLLDWLVRKERPGRRWAIATCLAIIGCSLLAAKGGSLDVNPLGLLLAVGAGVSYAIYTLSVKGLLDDRSPDAVMAVVFCLGALMLSPLFFTADLHWLAEPRGIAVALHLGLVATALSYFLFARGLRTVPVSSAVTLSLAEPLTAGLLGVTVVGERLTLPAVAGIALLFLGLVLLATGFRDYPADAATGRSPDIP